MRQAEELDGSATPYERRAFPRFPVTLDGACSLGGTADLACAAVDMSLCGVALRCAATPDIGADVVVSLPQVNLLRGSVARTWAGHFAVALADGRKQRERIAAYLVWLVARDTDAGLEGREHERLVPLRRVVTLVVEETPSTARILDVSRSGVAVSSTRPVEVGAAVTLGVSPAVVVRLFVGGFAARFTEPLGPGFDASVVL